MCSKFLKFCSIILTIVLLINLLPMQVLGTELKMLLTQTESVSSNSSNVVHDDELDVSGNATIIGETVDKRTEFSKEFKLSNGLNMIVVYPEAVHFQKDNIWEEIDNTLMTDNSCSVGIYRNKNNSWNVSLPQQLSATNKVTVEKNGYVVSFGMAGEKRQYIGRTETELLASVSSNALVVTEAVKTTSAQVVDLNYEEVKSKSAHPEAVADTLQSRLRYNNVYQNTDVQYDLNSYQLKESIILHSYNAAVQGYNFLLETGGLIPVLQDDNSIALQTAQAETVMTLPAPYMIDDNGEISTDVDVTLTASTNGYLLSYQMPTDWLSDSGRAWPVVLDPIIEFNSARKNIRDQFVAEYYYEDNNHGAMYCGYNRSYGRMRSFLKYVDIPELTSADVIVHAELSLYRFGGSVSLLPIEAHKVLGDWDSETITWANQPGYNPIIEDYCKVGTTGRYSWEITDIVKDWYKGDGSDSNTGVMLKVPDSVENGTTNFWKKFYTVDYDQYDLTIRPEIYIYFRNNNGLESYWDYTTVSAGRAGTGYTNNYSGNLTWTRGDIGFGGNRMPVSISHVYNTNDSNLNEFGMGYGWRTNFNQTVYPWNNIYYVWEDGDGTKHYFAQDSEGIYRDEDGLELKMTVSDNEVTIEDKAGNISRFEHVVISNLQTDNVFFRLCELKNNQATPSSIIINYLELAGEDTLWIDTIIDGVGRVYRFTYTDALLNKIAYFGYADPNQIDSYEELAQVAFAYDGRNLTTITDNDGKFSLYTYSNHYLTSAQDVDLNEECEAQSYEQGWHGYKLSFAYSDGMPKRIASIAEWYCAPTGCDEASVEGRILTFDYGHNQTTIKDHINNVEILQFNDWGNVISIQDNAGRAQFAQFARNKHDDNSELKANQLLVSSKLQDTADGEIVVRDSFENPPVWPYEGDAIQAELSAAEAYDGTYSMKITNSDEYFWGEVAADTLLLLPGETVKFSSYVKVISGEVNLAVELTDSAPAASALNYSNSPVWEKLEVTYTNTTSIPEELYCSFYFLDSAVVYVDCAVIETFREDSRQNLLQNGDFRDNNAWSLFSGLTTKNPATPHLDGNVYSMTGNPSSAQSISQTIPISGSANDCYILAGWAQGNSAPLRDDRTFGLRLTFNYTENHSDEEESGVYVAFNADYYSPDYWQYAAKPAVADYDYESITVEIVYDYNVNTVYFDGIQLFKENYGTTYTYDDNGNVISVEDLQNQKTEYSYDNTTQNLLSIELPDGKNIRYTYDSYHNVTTATTVLEHTNADGSITEEVLEIYTFTYDAYGNNTSVSIGNGSAQMTSSAIYDNQGNTLASATDAAGNITTYQYNAATNVLEWVKYPNDTDSTKTTYTYDSMYRLAATALTTNTNLNMSAEYTYENDLLTAIETGSTTYSFQYGTFSQRSSVQIGSRNLATYTYTNDKNRYLSQLAYGNGDSVQYTYDRYGRVTQETYEDGSTVNYYYDNSGDLNYVADSDSGRSTAYYYDFIGRAVKYIENGMDLSHTVQYYYDTENLLTSMVETVEYMFSPMEYTMAYTYDDRDRVQTVTVNGITRTYTYDTYGRIVQMEDTQGEITLQTVAYTYHDTAERISPQIAMVRTTRGNALDITEAYTYDDNGNILGIVNDTNIITYAYDSANQLIRENNQAAGKTWTWTYDNAGNILSKKEYAYTLGNLGTPIDTINYSYGNAAWGDLLTAYDGKAITYDTIGNPLNDGTWTYTWRNGRELASMSDGAVTWRYTYDANGMRTGRWDGNTYYDYVYNGSLLRQIVIDWWQTIGFTYDASGIPLTITYYDEVYYYITNLQGDVIGIADSTGALVVRYSYDAWGKHLSITGSMADTLGAQNPLRYRGYVYDTETGLYYLQSRYYNPEIGRFINADAFTSTGQDLVGSNMFAYCGNNPVCRVDLNGEWWRVVKAIVAVAVVVVAVNIAYSVNNWAHVKHNQSLKVDGYIYNQSQGIAAQYKFGICSSDKNGCGWIATYNALIMLEDPQTPDKIISYYERRGALFWGVAGINPTAVAGYFRSRGYTVTVSYNTSKFDQQAKNNTANILFYWHSEGAHNIAVQWDGRRFVGYNITFWDSGPIPLGTSLAAWLKTNGFTGPMLTSISRGD